MTEERRGWFVHNLANFVTVLGLLTSLWFLVVGINYPDMLWLVLLLGIITGLSDFADGKIARYLNIRTSLGVVLDTVRDKIFICSAIGVLFWQYWPSNQNFIITTFTETLCISVILLEISLFSVRVYGLYRKKDVTAGQNGKIKMFGEFFAVAFWLISLTIDKYCVKGSIDYVIYVVDFILLASFYFGVKGFSIYCREYSQVQQEISNK